MIEFEPSSSPGINTLLEAAQACFVDPGQTKQAFLRQQVTHIQAFRESLESRFAAVKQQRPRTNLYLQTEPELQRSFADFRDGMKRIETFLEGAPRSELATGCLKTRLAVDEIMRLSNELHQEELALAPECDSPAIRELVIALDGVTRGQVEASVLFKQLEAYAGQIQGFLQGLAESRKAGLESPELEELAPELEAAADNLEQLVLELLQACQSGSVANLQMGREPLIDTGQFLWDLNLRWQAALARRPVQPRRP